MKVLLCCDAELQCIIYCVGKQPHRRCFEASMEDVPHSETPFFYAKGLEAIDLWIGRCVHKGVSPLSDLCPEGEGEGEKKFLSVSVSFRCAVCLRT